MELTLEELVTEAVSVTGAVACPVLDSVATTVDEVASDTLVAVEPAGMAAPTSGCLPESGVVERPHGVASLVRLFL